MPETSESSGLSTETLSLILEYAVPVAGVLLILIAGLILAGWTRRGVRRSLERADFDPTLSRFFANMARYLILVLVVMFCLGRFGFDTTSVAGIFAAAGLAIGLALSGMLSNFSAGVLLLTSRPFTVGDVVNAAGVTGKVNAIDLFTTTMDTPDNRRMIVPNGAIFGGTIENITHHDVRRADVAVGVDYTADIDRVREVLEKAAAGVPGQVPDRDPAVVLLELGGSSVDWQVRVWAPSSDFFPVREATVRAVKRALDEAGIGIPYPQMDVHLDGAVATKGGGAP